MSTIEEIRKEVFSNDHGFFTTMRYQHVRNIFTELEAQLKAGREAIEAATDENERLSARVEELEKQCAEQWPVIGTLKQSEYDLQARIDTAGAKMLVLEDHMPYGTHRGEMERIRKALTGDDQGKECGRKPLTERVRIVLDKYEKNETLPTWEKLNANVMLEFVMGCLDQGKESGE